MSEEAAPAWAVIEQPSKTPLKASARHGMSLGFMAFADGKMIGRMSVYQSKAGISVS
jgi:hypothetical protein